MYLFQASQKGDWVPLSEEAHKKKLKAGPVSISIRGKRRDALMGGGESEIRWGEGRKKKEESTPEEGSLFLAMGEKENV